MAAFCRNASNGFLIDHFVLITAVARLGLYLQLRLVDLFAFTVLILALRHVCAQLDSVLPTRVVLSLRIFFSFFVGRELLKAIC